MRVLALDPGLTLGYAALGGGKPPAAGSRFLKCTASQLGDAGLFAESIIRGLVVDHGPIDVMAYATPFVGEVSVPIFKGGNIVGYKRVPIQPDALRPLMGLQMVIEMIAKSLEIRCTEWNEGFARAAFMERVPRKSKDIKRAVMQACRDRGWPCCDDHAGDALCLASYALDRLEPDDLAERTPLFIAKITPPAAPPVVKPARPRRK